MKTLSCEPPSHYSSNKKTKENKRKQQQRQDSQYANTIGNYEVLLPLFHDGPIFYHTVTVAAVVEDDDRGIEGAMCKHAEDMSFLMACTLVNQVLREVDSATVTDITKNAEEWKGAKIVLKALLIQHQEEEEEEPMDVPYVLRTLRSYRASLRVAFVQEQQLHEHQQHLLLGMTRLLLEIALSYGTPISIKRACVSCADTIISVLVGAENNANPSLSSSSSSAYLDNLYISLLTSILTITPSTPWSHPMTTLYNLVTYYCQEHIVNLLYQQPKTLLLQLFLMMDHYMYTSTPLSPTALQSSHSITTILEGNSFNPPQQLDLEDVNVRLTTMKAIDFALQVTTILRSILIPLLHLLLPDTITKLGTSNTTKTTTTTTTTTTNSNTDLLVKQLIQVLQRLQYSPLTTLLQCRMTPTDNLSILGIATAQVKLYQWYLGQQLEELTRQATCTTLPAATNTEVYHYHELHNHILSLVQQYDPTSTTNCYSNETKIQQFLPKLHHVALVRGWIAVSPPALLLYTPSLVKATSNPTENAYNENDDSNNDFLSNQYNGNDTIDCNNLAISSFLLLGPMFQYLLETVLNDPSASVRLSALRGWDSWISRILAILTTNTITTTVASTYDGTTSTTALDDCKGNANYSKILRTVLLRNDCILPQTITDMILIMWSRPPTRQIAAVLPVVFSSLCNLLQHIDDVKQYIAHPYDIINTARTTIETDNNTYLTLITKRILRQPLNRKGRYEALEILLPFVGAKTLLAMEEQTEVVSSLLQGIADGDNNCGAIAQLLGKILVQLLKELTQEQSNEDAPNTSNNTNSDNATSSCPTHRNGTINSGSLKNTRCHSLLHPPTNCKTITNQPPAFHDWLHVWINPMASALLYSNRRRRNQIAAFCLPLIVPISLQNRYYASIAMETLISELTQLSVAQSCATGLFISTSSCQNASDRDIYLWAFLECAHYASSQKLILLSPQLRKCMAKCLPLEQFKAMLLYSDQSLRLAGFLAIEAMVPCYVSESDDIEVILHAEMALWKFALPYASKTNDKGYTKNLLDCLNKLLRRLCSRNQMHSTDTYFEEFVCSFLVDGIALQLGLYPGTAAEKEYFSLSLIRTVFNFACGVMVTSEQCGSKVLHHLVYRIMSLLFLVNSTWDTTRSTSFELVCDITCWALENDVMLPLPLYDDRERRSLFFRAVHLASSPRQREADSGAKMLGLLYISSTSSSARDVFFRTLLSLATDRLELFGAALASFAFPNPDNAKVIRTTSHAANDFIPLAHGIFNALNVIVDKSRDITFSLHLEKTEYDTLCHQLASLCIQAIKSSMYVVAHMEKFMDDSESTFDADDDLPNMAANNGPLGANSSFTLLIETTEEENNRRVRSQRVMVGSWLLIKEACGALATVFSAFQGAPQQALVETSGALLISALVSLKHQGAAFSAHKSLQRIAEYCQGKFCFDKSIESLPFSWSKCLLHEISGAVQNSTLRRSTGYALGFLSILRTEPKPRCCINPFIIASLVRMALPPQAAIQCASSKLGITIDFAYLQVSEIRDLSPFISDSTYEWKSRVHALNILRLLILDSPMASDTKNFIGDTIIAGLLGYEDDDWAVRNSSTMVFAAAMLRVVDANKNALSHAESDVSKKQGNAITARELFRNYPQLSSFFAAVLDKCLHSSTTYNHGSMYPALLMLARLQPAEMTVDNEGEAEVYAPFITLLFGCLEHWHQKIRCMAGRALACFCCGDKSVVIDLSRSALLSRYMALIPPVDLIDVNDANIWNRCHGALAAIYELLITSTNAIQYLEDKDVKLICFYASWSNGTATCPPLCSAAALDILSHMNDTELLDRVAMKALETVTLIQSQQQLVTVIGIESLSVTASKLVVLRARKVLFSKNASSKEREFFFSRLKFVLCSSSFDIRLTSIKTFKKDLYMTVQRFASRPNQRNIKTDVFHRTVSLLYLSIEVELENDLVSLGPYPPNLRRLTKCLVDVSAGFSSSLDVSSAFRKYKDIWEVLFELGRFGNLFLFTSPAVMHVVTEKRCNSLAAASVELMAFILKGELTLDVSFANHARQFVDAVGILIHPHNSFDVRYRATKAIKTSEILKVSVERSRYDTTLSEVEKLRLMLFRHTFTLLQDDDEDIRSLAAMAASESLNSEDLYSGSSFLSLFTLERFFSKYCEIISTSMVVDAMMTLIIENCGDLESITSPILKEFSFTENENETSLNICSDRVIFEIEEPNPYKERLVLAQLAASSWVCSGSKNGDASLALMIHEQCKYALDLLTSRFDCCFAHQLSQLSLVFPAFQGILLGGICLVYSGMEKLCSSDHRDETSIVEDAKQSILCIESNTKQTSTIHRWLLQTLQVLAYSKQGCSSTREGLVKCCFLLPQLGLNFS